MIPQNGWKGVVVCIERDYGGRIGVQWEQKFAMGHTCSSNGAPGMCRYYTEHGRNHESVKMLSHSAPTEYSDPASEDEIKDFLFG